MTSTEQTLKKLRGRCLSFPEVSEAPSWGHPNFRAGKKTFATFERVKGRASIAFRLDPDDIDRLLSRMTAAARASAAHRSVAPTRKAAPAGRGQQFFVTPYGRGQWISLWADGALDWRIVEDLLDRSYRVVALKRMLTALESTRAR